MHGFAHQSHGTGVRLGTDADVPFVSSIIGADAADIMSRVITLLTPNGGFFLEPITSSILEAHMFFRPTGRGKEALHGAREGLRYCFNVLGAIVVFGRIPMTDRPARLFTRMIGFKSDGIRAHSGTGEMVEYFEMRKDSPCLQH